MVLPGSDIQGNESEYNPDLLCIVLHSGDMFCMLSAMHHQNLDVHFGSMEELLVEELACQRIQGLLGGGWWLQSQWLLLPSSNYVIVAAHLHQVPTPGNDIDTSSISHVSIASNIYRHLCDRKFRIICWFYRVEAVRQEA